ncbi:hypothetical protein MBH78_17075 [Oceanimonas sp. NS1]|nr:hypothetical protein [Oceanimonas sp. NS1]
MPRGPVQAKGLLLAAIACPDPVIFLNPSGCTGRRWPRWTKAITSRPWIRPR